MIGTPCDVGTSSVGTLSVSYTPQTDGTDSISWVCNQNNPQYALNITIAVGGQGQSCVSNPLGQICTPIDGTITVTSSPGSINCSGSGDPSGGFPQFGACTDAFSKGTTVTLTAAPFQNNANSSVGPWSGCDSVSADGSTCTVTMDSLRSVSVFSNYKS
jgi:hypothetical protein